MKLRLQKKIFKINNNGEVMHTHTLDGREMMVLYSGVQCVSLVRCNASSAFSGRYGEKGTPISKDHFAMGQSECCCAMIVLIGELLFHLCVIEES